VEATLKAADIAEEILKAVDTVETTIAPNHALHLVDSAVIAEKEQEDLKRRRATVQVASLVNLSNLLKSEESQKRSIEKDNFFFFGI
jgi:hypothetical protein